MTLSGGSLGSILTFLTFLPLCARAEAPPVQVVLFTHIEDNTPLGVLGSPQNRDHYLALRGRLIEVGRLMQEHAVPWSLQPDWKLLRAALLFEDAELMATTNGKNVLHYLKEDLGVVIDPHSHENGGYNYTDVAHLLDSLGAGGSTVIGGHVWDPSYPQFQEWDRFRVPVSGERYPWALWRGDILMGSGTPMHVDDPVVSGVWRPRDRDHYFDHDPSANITAVGQYKGTIEGIAELAGLYDAGVVSPEHLLTSSFHIRPATIQRADGMQAIQDSVIAPLQALQASGAARATDFSALVASWEGEFGGRGFLFDGEAATTVETGDPPTADRVRLEACFPTPASGQAGVRFRVEGTNWVRLSVCDVRGRMVATLADGVRESGSHALTWDASALASGVYFYRLESCPDGSHATARVECAKFLLLRGR